VLEALGTYGVRRVLHATSELVNRYQGEIFSLALCEMFHKELPTCLLMTQSAMTEDLAQRTAAMLNTALVTRAMDFSLTADGRARAIRPVANGY
jgi:electron transfer flavoprotein alpha subunit